MNNSITLHRHQVEASKFAVEKLLTNGYAALLMEMGTGKTYTSLAIIEMVNMFKQVFPVIICPKAIIPSWTKQLDDFGAGAYVVWGGRDKARAKKWQAQYQRAKIFLVNVEAFQKPTKRFKDARLFSLIPANSFIIVDESSKIKNAKANRTRNIIALEKELGMIMTGTEMSNDITNVYSQFEFLKKYFWGLRNFYAFRSRYAIMREIPIAGGRYIKVVVGAKKVSEIRSKIDSCSYRIKKEECLDLPEKIQETIDLDMHHAQKKVYHQLKNEMWCEYKENKLVGKSKLSLYVAFMQITCGFFPGTGELIGSKNVKIDYIMDATEDYEEKFLIWSNFRAPIEYLCNNYDVSRYDGTMKEEHTKKFYALNIKTGAYGLSLQYCSNTFYLQRSLSLEENLQSEDRQHRIGQKNNVLYRNLVFKDTVDEKIMRSYEHKHNMVKDFENMGIEEFMSKI